MTSVLDLLNSALHQAFAADERVYLIGEDLLDPYGGAFKVAKGLSSTYPGRVLSTPISEAAITGLAAGMALRGLRPVVEIMFGDFVTLAADQLVNHIAKFRWMYNDQVRVPLVLRTPMGGRRGYGPTHSQTIEKLFLGVPGLRVLAPCSVCVGDADAGSLLKEIILESEDPTLFIENKLLYLLPVGTDGDDFTTSLVSEANESPTYQMQLRGAPAASLTICTYGYMVELARQAVLKLGYEHEVFCNIIAPTQLSPVQCSPLLAAVEKSTRLLTVEEGTYSLGWGAEIIAQATEKLNRRLRAASRVAALDLPVPASGPLESAVLPSADAIIEAVLALHRFA